MVFFGTLASQWGPLWTWLHYRWEPLKISRPFDGDVAFLLGPIGYRDAHDREFDRLTAAGFQLLSRSGELERVELHLWYVDTGQPCWFGRYRDEYRYSAWDPSGVSISGSNEVPLPEWDEEIPKAPWIVKGLSFEEWWGTVKPESYDPRFPW